VEQSIHLFTNDLNFVSITTYPSEKPVGVWKYDKCYPPRVVYNILFERNILRASIVLGKSISNTPFGYIRRRKRVLCVWRMSRLFAEQNN